MINIIKRSIPLPIKRMLARIKKSLIYTNYDSSLYWKKRASEPGQAAVMWKNQDYNCLYRKDQKEIINRYLERLDSGDQVLDIGCGIGVVSEMILDIRGDLKIDAVDFDEMIQVAQNKTSSGGINFIGSSAEEYFDASKRYQLILSSGCYSAIRDIRALEKSLENAVNMLDDGGIILMIDPFHRWSYLARAKYNSRDVINYLKQKGDFELLEKSGVLFWPYREWLANSAFSGKELEQRYQRGEKILKRLGSHFWADYKILAFKKQ